MLRLPLALATATGLLAGVAAVPASATPAPEPSAPVWSTGARPAQQLIDSVGVGVHLAYEDTPYADAGRVATALADLGVSHVRDDLFLDDPEQGAAIRRLAQGGVRFDLIAGRPGNGRLPGEYVDQAAALAPAVESLEGPNEWDLSGRPAWAAELVAYQAGLYAAAKLDPRTTSLPVLSPALAFSANTSVLGSIPGLADVANGHLYTGGRPPSLGLDTLVPRLQAWAGVTPVVVTETGYHNAVNTTDGHLAVPEDVSAVYQPRQVLEHFARGLARTYTYELIDEFDDPGRTNPEANFGLLRHDWSPKPAYTALRNLLDLAEGGPAGAAPASPMSYDLIGAPADARSTVVTRSDGASVLFLWRDVSVFDPATQTRTPVAAAPVTVRLTQPSTYAVHRPTSSATAVGTGAGTSVPVALDGEVTAVVLRPGAVATAAPAAPATSAVAVPAPPRGVSVQLRGGRAVVTWRHSAGADRYRVSASDELRASVRGGVTRVVLTGLEAGRRYRFSVRARVEGAWSAPTVVARRAPGRS